MPPVYDVPSGRWHFLDEFHLKRHILYLIAGFSLGGQLISMHMKQTDHGSRNSSISSVSTVNSQQLSLFGLGLV